MSGGIIWAIMGKLGLTIVNCVMAIVLISLGLHFAQDIAEQRPLAAALLVLVSLVLPVVAITRIAWADGYRAGRRAAENFEPMRDPALRE